MCGCGAPGPSACMARNIKEHGPIGATRLSMEIDNEQADAGGMVATHKPGRCRFEVSHVRELSGSLAPLDLSFIMRGHCNSAALLKHSFFLKRNKQKRPNKATCDLVSCTCGEIVIVLCFDNARYNAQ
jgi:hypothetical protein